MSVVVSSSSGSTPHQAKVGVPPLNLHQINSVRLSIPSPAQTPTSSSDTFNTLSEQSNQTFSQQDASIGPTEELCKENVQPTTVPNRPVFKERPYLKEKKQRTIGVRDKMALFDLYPPSLTDVDRKIVSEDMINISRPINTQKFLLKRFPMLRHNPEKDKNAKGGGFVERPPLSPTVRSEQQVYNQQVFTTTVDPSAGLDVLPKSVQAPFAKELGALSSKLHIPQLPLDTLDMLTTDAFGNSLNSVRVNWVKSEEDLTRSVTLTSRSDAVFARSSFNRVASAGATRRYSGLKNIPSSKSLPSTARKKIRNFMEEASNSFSSKLDDNMSSKFHTISLNDEKDEDNDFNPNSETEQLIYDSLRTSYYLNLKEEKAKRKGQETITIEEHVKVTNDIIFKVTSAFKEKVKKIQLSMRKEIENIMKKYSSELIGVKEDRSDNIVNNFIKDKQIRRQLEVC
ncbi:hypothetical protein NAEGRDRAFT_77699 [Naegleria gruberi]|uniref:Uncharacterized protein n=1 Tax=Naegleria gruberi TaxID=5762 RepID=D2UXQ1_NAEGR|nr:uncharacterized protein NAEGRDRAFT_77699 [Naegleria gruberi]EFC50670.1 hypothetical protein NAEGRDRAFT_77699 [Naegleria gruberi]|eukprot:XP_002683414.1 hypothetical protein NAEGRDRAFT_77699 [Naegleria gruberi strain NEG-M]